METFISHSEEETILFAKDFAKNLKTGDIIVLSGELGSRKNKIYSRYSYLFWFRKRNIISNIYYC